MDTADAVRSLMRAHGLKTQDEQDELMLRLARDRAGLLAALKAMAALFDGIDEAVHQSWMDKVTAARVAIALAESA